MSLENDSFEYHLTPNGWFNGSMKDGFKIVNFDIPPDRFLTIVFRFYQASSFSKEERWHEILWESPNTEEIKKLKKNMVSFQKNLSILNLYKKNNIKSM